MDELQNRVFLLEDQLESREVASHQKSPPRVPVDARADRAPDSPSEAEIEYAGEARDATAPRPVLKLEGRQAPQLGQYVAEEPVEATPPPAAAPPKSAAAARAGRSVPPVPRHDWRPTVEGEDRLPVTRGVPSVPTKGGKDPMPSPPVAIASSQGSHAASPVPSPAPTRAQAAPPSAVDAMKLYNASVDLLKHGQHAEAITGLQKFVRTYPAHDYADNAQYWLGECYYDQKDFKSALREFRRVIQKFPTGNKAPDALLKVGYCYWQLQDGKNARDVLEQVLKSYPGTDVAKKASDKLHELK